MIRTKKGFIIRKLADSWMILAIGDAVEEFRDILQTNETGAFYWEKLKEGTTEDELVGAAMERFDEADPAEVRQDIREFLENIRETIEYV